MSIIKREKALDVGLRTLRKAGVEGVMVDVWWGIAEEAAPGRYDFSAYQRLFAKVDLLGPACGLLPAVPASSCMGMLVVCSRHRRLRLYRQQNVLSLCRPTSGMARRWQSMASRCKL